MIDLNYRMTDANLSVHTLNLLKQAGVDSVRDLQKVDERTLMNGKFGQRSIKELKGWMSENNINFKS